MAEEVDGLFPRPDWTSTYPGHGEGSVKGAYAIDFMCSRSDGNKIAEFIWEHRKRLGVRYIVWWGRIISETSETPNRWVRYFNADNPSPSKSHKNHVHTSRYPNAPYRANEKENEMPEAKDVWSEDINPKSGPANEHNAAWYLREAHKQAKEASLTADRIEKLLREKLK